MVKKPRPVAKGLWLVSWKDMMKGSDLPLPMRPFDTYEDAVTYRQGCADVLVCISEKYTDPDQIIMDFPISQT
tara:strand:- start:15 stop:233 length:219 start_codon:yes stop_codon:yes gene_type:complete